MGRPRRRSREKRLPVALSRAEGRAILDQVRQPVYRACLKTIYSRGLRISEGVALKVGDLDRQQGPAGAPRPRHLGDVALLLEVPSHHPLALSGDRPSQPR